MKGLAGKPGEGKEGGDEAIVLYGSPASGKVTSQSDLDVGVLLGRRERVDWQTLGALRSNLEAVARFPIDLDILKRIVTERLDDLDKFADAVKRWNHRIRP